MSTENYYITNNETGKLNIYFDLQTYNKLAEDQKKTLSDYCLWSKKQQCWISKGKAINCHYLRARLNDFGLIDRGAIGRNKSFKDKVLDMAAKATGQYKGLVMKSATAALKAAELKAHAQKLQSLIPVGQPHLIGHHSIAATLAYAEKVHKTYGKAINEGEKAESYSKKAAKALTIAEGLKFKDPVYLASQIKSCQKYIKLFERRLQGKVYIHSAPKEISTESKKVFTEKLKQEKEKFQYLNDCLKQLNEPAANNIPQKAGKTKGIKRKRP